SVIPKSIKENNAAEIITEYTQTFLVLAIPLRQKMFFINATIYSHVYGLFGYTSILILKTLYRS
ncbi:MAG: hypothetical protein WAL28_06580, partial [Nitrososphaeraceae archaeon]